MWEIDSVFFSGLGFDSVLSFDPASKNLGLASFSIYYCLDLASVFRLGGLDYNSSTLHGNNILLIQITLTSFDAHNYFRIQ